MTSPCERLTPTLGQLFSCAPVDRYTRIRTPFLFPDGTLIDLFHADGLNGETVSDLGESLAWLRSQTPTQRRTKRQRRLVEDVCVTHNVELFKGSLVARVLDPDDLAATVTRVAQACLRVADLSFLFRSQSFASVADEVEDFLAEQHLEIQRDEHLSGRSGTTWTIDFHTRSPRRSALVNVLSTGTRGAARGIAEHTLAAWYDLSHLKVTAEGLRFVSLIDDTLDVWHPEDIKLVAGLSDVALWSRPDAVAELLLG